MTLSVRLSSEDEQLLAASARRLGRPKSELVRQAIQELCQKLRQEERSAYALGEDLFGTGKLAEAPKDPMKKAIWEKLCAKHNMG